MDQVKLQIPKGMVPEVLALAAQFYANQIPNCTVSELAKVGTEIYLSAELIERAIQEIQHQHTSDGIVKAGMLDTNPFF